MVKQCQDHQDQRIVDSYWGILDGNMGAVDKGFRAKIDGNNLPGNGMASVGMRLSRPQQV